MAKTVETQDVETPIPLKDPEISAFLAWLIPGLGHLYQGRKAKAALYFVCIMGTFVYGLYLGGSSELGWGRVVYYCFRDGDTRLPYICQIGIGLPAMPALIQANRMANQKPVWWSGFMAPPRTPQQGNGPGLPDDPNRSQPTMHELNYKLARFFELGTVYTMIAGLLNVLAVYDALAGPVPQETAKKEEDEDEEEDQQEDAATPNEAAT